MICPFCGEQNEQGLTICAKCEAQLPQESATAKNTDPLLGAAANRSGTPMPNSAAPKNTGMQSMPCEMCGEQNEQGVMFCIRCGEKLQMQHPQPADARSAESPPVTDRPLMRAEVTTNLVLSVHFKQNYFEYFLPGENNRAIEVNIPASLSGFGLDTALALEVWEGEWFLVSRADTKAAGRVYLRGGLRINCTERSRGEKFAVIVEEVSPEYTAFKKYKARQGLMTIGRDKSNTICFNTQNLVSEHHATVEIKSDGSCIVTDRSQNGTFVNGTRISGSQRINFGDVVGIFGLKIVYLGDIIAINRPNAELIIKDLAAHSSEPVVPVAANGIGEGYYQRSPRLVEKLDDEIIEIEAPPNLNRSRRQPLLYTIGPSLTMVIPMSVGVVFAMLMAQQSGQQTGAFMFMGIITSATAAVIGIFWALMNVRYQRRLEAEEAKRRDDLFGQYLQRMCGILQEKQMINKSILDRLYPNVRECLDYARSKSLRLWERNVNHTDFLSVRLGLGAMPSPNAIQTAKEKFTMVDDALADEPRKIQNEFKLLRNVPICLSLFEHRLVGVIADSQKNTAAIARLLALQLSAYHSYTDLRMAFLYSKDEADEYAFTRWLPHVWSEDGETRLIAEGAAGVGEVLYSLSSTVRSRVQDEDDKKEKDRPLPHYIVFITDPAMVEGEALSKYFNAPTEELGMSVVLLYGKIGHLPNDCKVIIRQDRGFSGYCSLDSSFDNRDEVIFDNVTAREMEHFGRELSNYRVREEQSAGAVPTMLSFLDMYKTSSVEELDVYRNWLENRSFESMKAMIGYRNTDTPLYLDIHEKYHGPHGLVAGTTGSGKSETLQTYILSLAVNFDPREVSFILIDYKGGGMAKSFEGLPHVAGIITNLGGNQTNRALASINSEIKRRQSVFNEFGVKHIDEYIELFRAEKAANPMPHLLIIADEFAELKKEQPEFVRELVSAARVGRSLGIHLILATQDPSASVDDEIWSNTKFRVCLRVAGKVNSQAMLHRPDAAYITNTGRGYFQVGNDEIFELFQSGWSGAEYDPEIPYSEQSRNDIKMINLWGKAMVKVKKKKSSSGGEKISQLRAVVQHIANVATERSISAISDIWLPPLPERVTHNELEEPELVRGALSVALGLADYPTGQKQFAFSLDLVEEGHLLIAGPGGSGKTTLLQTLLFGLSTRYGPEQICFYIADFNSRTLGVFVGLPHCGGIVYDSDEDKIDKLVTMLTRELARRVAHFSEKGIGSFKEYSKLYDDVPAIVLAVDNFAAFTENNDKLQDTLVQLTRQSASYGMYLVLTCASASDVRSKIRQNIGCGIGLQLYDRFEYEDAIGAKPVFLADDRVTGRGLAVCDVSSDKLEVLEVQFALALDAPDSSTLNAGLRSHFADLPGSGITAARIPQVPGDLSIENLFNIDEIAQKCSSGRYMLLGYDIAEAAPLYVYLADTFCFSISGASRSGKTTYLKSLLTIAGKQGFKSYLFDAATRELENFARESGAEYLANTDELYSFMESVLVPELSRRNPAKGDYMDSGYANPDEYFASEEKICLFIHDMSAFCEAVYNSEKDMKSYLEKILLTKGKHHMVYLFACISPEDFTGEWSTKPVLRKFIGYKEGLHLGGNIDNQRVFDFEIPVLQRGQKLSAGNGHVVDNGETKRIVVVTL